MKNEIEQAKTVYGHNLSHNNVPRLPNDHRKLLEVNLQQRLE